MNFKIKMKIILSICLVFCLAASVNSIRLRTHTRSHSTTSQTWQAYVDQGLVGVGMSGALIMGLDGNVLASKNLNLKSTESSRIIASLAVPSLVLREGVFVNGIVYQTLKADSSSIYGRGGAGGVILAKTGKTVIIGTFGANLQQNAAIDAVEKLAAFVRSIGY